VRHNGLGFVRVSAPVQLPFELGWDVMLPTLSGPCALSRATMYVQTNHQSLTLQPVLQAQLFAVGCSHYDARVLAAVTVTEKRQHLWGWPCV